MLTILGDLHTSDSHSLNPGPCVLRFLFASELLEQMPPEGFLVLGFSHLHKLFRIAPHAFHVLPAKQGAGKVRIDTRHEGMHRPIRPLLLCNLPQFLVHTLGKNQGG